MPFQTDSIFPSGGMDKDLDLSLIKKGDYSDALNIQHISDGGSTSYAIQNTKGNLYRFFIPATLTQNKIYQVSGYGADGTTSRAVRFFFTDGSSMAYVDFVEGGTLLASINSARTAINTALAAATPAQTATILAGPGNTTFTIELTTVVGYEYSISGQAAFMDSSTITKVVQEAIDASLVGNANIIGSYDLLGQLYIWSTSQKNLPSVLSVTITAANNSGTIRITTSAATTLVSGQSIVISGATGTGAASTNGTWIINVINSTTFDLLNSAFSTTQISLTSTPIITINVEGIGEIGVANYDANTDVFTYIRLIKSKEFNFRIEKQVDTYCEENNFETSIYWTDDYNVPRVLYYSGAPVPDGAIQAISPLGKYSYGSIADETKLILTNELIGFNFTKQYVVGGGVLSGNWRYAVRLLTSTFSATNWTEIGNPINVYKADQSAANANAICGDDPSVVTSKINEFTVTNLTVGVFKFIELAGINYVGGAISGSILKRIVIDSSTMTIQHTGVETGVTNLDVSTLNQFSFDIETAKNIDAIDNRLILSNLTTAQEIDFSAFALTIKHAINQQIISNIGVATAGTGKFGEFQDPLNVYNYAGYRIHETYRVSMKFQLTSNGNFTKSFWVDDITIDNLSTNHGSATRRVNGLPNLNLTSSGADPDVYVPYIQLSNIDPNYIIDGERLKDIVSSIHVERVDMTTGNREVLASGALIPTVSGISTGEQIEYGGGAGYGENPYVVGFNGTGHTYPKAGFSAVRTVAKLYSPDVFCGLTALSYSGSEIVKFSGNPEVTDHYASAIVGNYAGDITEWNGYYNNTGSEGSVSATGLQNILDAGSPVSIGGITYYGILDRASGDNWRIRGGALISTVGSFTNVGGNADYGFYYASYCKFITYTNSVSNKFGNPDQSVYIPTGAILNINTTLNSLQTINVFGGDAFTQKTFLKNRGAEFVNSNGGGSGVSFYSQNLVNSQMIKKYDNSSSAWLYPNTPPDNWVNTQDLGTAIAPYNSGYTIVNGISVDVAFDPNLPDQTDLPTEIRWSDLKPQNAVVDNFRIFLPLNFKDLPLSWGEITDHENFNGELFTFQPRMVQRQYFNTRGTMNVGGQTPTEVLIGDGSVMSRDGAMVTGIGSYHKWGIIKGKSAQGNDVLYWPNTELKKWMRMGYDGTISIADIHGMQSFAANNLTWVIGKDNPASGQGICGTWDDRYMAAIWTVMGQRSFAAWASGTTYAKGATVSAGARGGVYSTYEETGEIYISLAAGNIGNNPITSPNTHWFLVPHQGMFTVTYTDTTTATHNANEYCNEYTIEFNEQKNKFTTFYTFKPRIYLKWTDTFLTPQSNPSENTGFVFEHRLGNYCSWYGGAQVEDASITMIYNQGINSSKLFLATWFYGIFDAANSFGPARIDITTKRHQTFMLNTDSENNLDYFSVPIKNDITTSSNGQINSEDTSKIFGEYILVKVTLPYAINVFQKIIDVVLKFWNQARQSNK